jgi:hypothetical protein
MKSLFTSKPILAAALVFGALGATTAANAATDVFLSIGVPGAYVQPQPVYVQPQPVYVQPQPVYVQPQYGHAYGGSGRGGNWGDADRDGVPNVYDRDSRRYDSRAAWNWRSPRGDADRDGVPNRYDRDSRHYQPQAHHRAGGWGDADRDGVPNRYDDSPRNPHRR